MTDEPIEIELPKGAKGLSALVRAVDKDKAPDADIAALVLYFLENPGTCDALGNLCRMTQTEVTKRAFTINSIRIAVDVRLRQMRDDMGYDDASELERSLIDHVILCWVRLHDCELRYHMAGRINATIDQAAWLEKKLSANQSRYLKAVETLARVRRLNINVQINVGQQQIVTG